MKKNSEKFTAFILTNGRPDNVKTIKTLERCGYTGSYYLIVDDLDQTKDQYIKNFGDKVIIFDKKEIAKTFDQGDNFNDMRAIIYARNATFEIAKNLGIKYFIQLDDDYTTFRYRFDDEFKYNSSTLPIKRLDQIWELMLDFYIKSGVCSLAMSQGGDFIGGENSALGKNVRTKRKAMNSFFCSTDRPFQFIGRVNEDVNTYTRHASTGPIFLTLNQVCLEQMQTQSNAGGMSEMYLDSGTYIKSFYSVMYHPSSVSIREMGTMNRRLHHFVTWRNTVPMILNQKHKKV